MGYPKYKRISPNTSIYYLDLTWFNSNAFLINRQFSELDGETICLHNENGPSVIIYDNDRNIIYEEYHHYGFHHRVGAPAINGMSAGESFWCVNGEIYRQTKEYCEACGYDAETIMFWMLKYGEFLPITYDL